MPGVIPSWRASDEQRLRSGTSCRATPTPTRRPKALRVLPLRTTRCLLASDDDLIEVLLGEAHVPAKSRVRYLSGSDFVAQPGVRDVQVLRRLGDRAQAHHNVR